MLKNIGQNKHVIFGIVAGASAVLAGSTAFYIYKRNQW